MRLIYTLTLFLVLNTIFLSCKANSGTPTKEEESTIWKNIGGNSIQIDPLAFYNSGISYDQLIKDLKKANIKSVHLFLVNFWDGKRDNNLLKPELLKVLKDNGFPIWLMVLGNCFYEKPDLPDTWQMGLMAPYPGVYFYSFHHPDFVKWQANRVKNIIKNYPEFVGIEFAESYFPEWKTVANNGFYGDVSAYALNKFSKSYLTGSQVYTFDEVRKSTGLYKKWIEFRSDAIVNFNKEIKQAIKSSNPDVLFASWGMGVRGGTMAEIKEHFGLDMERIVKEVKPDIYYVQTAAQDWGDATLQPDYFKSYDYVFNALKKADSNVKIGVQADIASLSYHNPDVQKRSGTWWSTFMNGVIQHGYFTNTAYEYTFYKKQGLWIN